jgi:hypothetical protein
VPAVFPTIIVVHLSTSANALSELTTALKRMLARTVRSILGGYGTQVGSVVSCP